MRKKKPSVIVKPRLPPGRPARRNNYLLLSCLVIAVITAVAFSPSLKNGFTNWDDDLYVSDNYDIHGLAAHNVGKVFSSYYVGNYQPLTMLTYMAEYSWFKLSPAAYHATNIVIHIVNALLLLFLIYGLTGGYFVSFVVALLFAIHPLRVESVAWVAERKDVLSTLFYLLSLHAYLSFTKKGSKGAYGLSLLFFVFSLLSKPMGVSLPLVLLLVDYLKKRKLDRKALLEKVPFAIITAAFIPVILLAQKSGGAIGTGALLSLSQKLLIPFYGTAFYLVKTLFPFHLSSLYPFVKNPEPATIMRMWLSPFLVTGLAAAVWYSRKFSRKGVFGALFFLITALPILQILPVGSAVVAERYSYIPAIGLYFIIAEALAWFINRNPKTRKTAQNMVCAVLVLIFSLFACLTFQRCAVWKDSLTLWNDVLAKFPNSPRAFSSRAGAYAEQGRHDLAIADFTRAIPLTNNPAEEYMNRGKEYVEVQEYDKAITDLTTALSLNPKHAHAYLNRGVAYQSKGMNDLAMQDFTKALAIKPDLAEGYNGRGLIFQGKGQNDAAIEDYSRAIALKPGLAQLYNNRGGAYNNIKEYDKAIADLTTAISLNPNLDRVYFNRGMSYQAKGLHDLAIADFSKALTLNPAGIYVCAYRGKSYQAEGRNDLAVADFDKAKPAPTNDLTEYYNRGVEDLNRRNFDQAIADLSKAIAINSGVAEIYNNRGIAYSQKGLFEQALGDFNKAIALKPDLVMAVQNRDFAFKKSKERR